MAGRSSSPRRRQLARRRRHERPRDRARRRRRGRRHRPPPPSRCSCFRRATTDAVGDGATRLAAFLEDHPDINLADVAHTLVTGRRAMPRRRVVVATDVADAPVAMLRSNDRNRVVGDGRATRRPRSCSCSRAAASQYNGMAAGLDDRFDVFHEVMARRHRAGSGSASGLDLAPLLRPDAAERRAARHHASLPAVFLTSVALARQWMAWGVDAGALARPQPRRVRRRPPRRRADPRRRPRSRRRPQPR